MKDLITVGMMALGAAVANIVIFAAKIVIACYIVAWWFLVLWL